MDPLWNIPGLLGFGFTIWYATGIDDAIIFGSIMAGAKSKKEKIEATIGLIAMYLVMLIVVISIGSSLTLLLETQIAGIPLKRIIFMAAAAFVFKLGLNAWNENNETTQIETMPPKKNWFDTGMTMLGGGMIPRIAQDAFKGFGLNCTDDIAVNSANIIDKTHYEIAWYLLGNSIGMLTTIAIVWCIYNSLQHFADGYLDAFNEVRAVAIWFAALLIFYSAIA